VGGEEYAEASQRQWGAAAEAWARAGEEPERGASAEVAAWMLEAAELRPGQRVLELACGAGRVGLQAAEAVGVEGHVLCSDFAEPMVEAVRKRAEALALTEGERFDRVLCRFGYMLMSDPLQALGQSRDALEPDGRLVLAVWGRAEQNPWLATLLQSVIDHFGAPPPEPGMPGPFALGDPQRLADLLERAGFEGATITRLEPEQTYESAEEWWERITAIGGPLAAALGAIQADDVAAIRERALQAAAAFVRADGSAVFPASVLAATAPAT
jgi:SAM-dependent methyltransferase